MLAKKDAEEAWETADKLPRREFDPRTFFKLHDIDGDGFLNIVEIRQGDFSYPPCGLWGS